MTIWRDYPNDHGGWSRRSNKFGARLPIVAHRVDIAMSAFAPHLGPKRN